MKKKDASIYDEYFNYVDTYREKYGEHTVVLIMVGSFYEVYGMKTPESFNVSGSNIEEYADCCQLNISEKAQQYKNAKIIMAGFPDYSLDKYLAKLVDGGFTVPVVTQQHVAGKIIRSLDQVYSSGTYIPQDVDMIPASSNNIMCIWIELHKKQRGSHEKIIVYGISVINIFTGKSYLCQHNETYHMTTTIFDEMERCVSIYSPNEVILITPYDDDELNKVIQYAGIISRNLHKFGMDDKKVSNCSTQKYMKEIITHFYDDTTYDVCEEFYQFTVATQSFCFLLDFVREHNPDIVRKIELPIFNSLTRNVLLANHALRQLNVINDSHSQGFVANKYSSVLSLLTNCSTAMGKRMFQSQITCPTFDEEWLNREYNAITYVMTTSTYRENLENIRKQMKKIRDIEKINRQIVIKSIYPDTVASLYNSLEMLSNVSSIIEAHPDIEEYVFNDICDSDTDITSMCKIITDYLEENFIIDSCHGVRTLSAFNANIIQSGVSEELDNAIVEREQNTALLNDILYQLNQHAAKCIDAKNADIVKIYDTEKSGQSLIMTSRRSQTFKTYISKMKNSTIKLIEGESFKLNDIHFGKASGSNVELQFPLVTKVCKSLLESKSKINRLISCAYSEIVRTIDAEYTEYIDVLSAYTAKLDVIQSKAFVSIQYNYCKPIIDVDATRSYVKAKQLRHCIVEQIQMNEIYVTNDIEIGTDKESGFLLYGTNAVGKTTTIRALGIAVILAQCGMFVPCSEFIYKPYHSMFTRIIGNDNLFRGLSTFAVEMSELRVILNMSNENSLILGDELCSGTETESALSIFVAGLMRLTERKSSFIFATHFHEIVEYDEIKNMTGLSLKHMSVYYDRESDCLVYDRIMKDGSGPRMYGLEVCKSLRMENEFLEIANQLRTKYFKKTQGILSYSPTTYNSKKVRTICEMCKENVATETHHLRHQKDADKEGFIDGSFHKNHVANLMSICEECHLKIHHDENSPSIRKKTTKGYKLM